MRATCTFDRRLRGGSRPGLRKVYDQAAENAQPVQFMAGVSVVDAAGALSRVFVASAGGLVHHVSDGNLISYGVGFLLTEAGEAITTESISELALGTSTLNGSVDSLQVAERAQNLYIADHGPIEASGLSGTLTDGVLTDASIPDFSARGISMDSSACQIVIKDGSATTGTYAIIAIGVGSITLDCPNGTSTVAYEIRRCPVVLDPKTGIMDMLLPTAGNTPLGCPLMALYRDRLVLAGPDHIWYMSRQGDPTNWDYGADVTDPATAVAGTASSAGTPGEPIRALIPYSDDYLLLGCENSLWIFRGDPASGGQLDCLSRGVGVAGASSWCRLPDSSLFFLARDGLYSISPGSGTYPTPISRNAIPEDLIDIDTAENTVVMCYDGHHGGVHINITPSDGTTGTHWWVQVTGETKGYWPVVLADAHQPTSMLSYAADPSSENRVFLGCTDGYIREYDDATEEDDGIAFDSFVFLGPFRPGGDDYNHGIISEIIGTTAAGSGPVNWALYTSRSCSEIESTVKPRATGVIPGGRSRSFHPRVDSGAASLRLSSAHRWALEQITLNVLPRGKQRQ